MDFKTYADLVITFVQTHQAWAVPIVFLLSFGESLAFLSILIPSTPIMLALGGLFAASGIPLFPIWLAAVIGSVSGYAVSYWVGLYFKDHMPRLWPFSRYPDMLPQGQRFFERYGAYGIMIGHLISPMRAVLPVIAGMYAMPGIPFQIGNLLGAIAWATLMLIPAYYGIESLKGWVH